jgi:hypothetical protein
LGMMSALLKLIYIHLVTSPPFSLCMLPVLFQTPRMTWCAKNLSGPSSTK